MRAARLLRILFLLQGRGRMTSVALAAELEVTARTILRDVDALTEAGLPIIVHRGAQGGIELGFDHRTRLTGLSRSEAEALAVILNRPAPELGALGFTEAAVLARAKIVQSLPGPAREQIEIASQCFRFDLGPAVPADPTLSALAEAVREARLVTATTVTGAHRELHPSALVLGTGGWRILDTRPDIAPIAVADLGALQIGPPGSSRPGRSQ